MNITDAWNFNKYGYIEFSGLNTGLALNAILAEIMEQAEGRYQDYPLVG